MRAVAYVTAGPLPRVLAQIKSLGCGSRPLTSGNPLPGGFLYV